MAFEDRPRSADDAPLTCRELTELITAYLEDALPPARGRRFEEHLMRCESCGRYLAQMRTTIRLTGTLTPDDLSAAARRALLAAFRTWKKEAYS